jgi:lipopolysaccharide biosynthesis regulator YciM
MADYLPLLVGLIALLVGLATGKAWERYKLRDGRWIDRRKARESPHYILGLNFLVSNQIDLAIEELSRAASLNTEALEIDMILGNLYREKGQVGRAIHVHQALLQRPKLTKLEHAYVTLCLGLDFKRGGFVDRALEAFNEVMRLDPKNRYALANLEKLHEEQHQWQEAYQIRQRLMKVAEPEQQASSQSILAFLENELGLQALGRGDDEEAAQRFAAAIQLDARTAPAYLNLGDVRLRQGRVGEAIAAWEHLIEVSPERAYLAFERLESAYPASGGPEKFGALCRRLIQANPKDWRARLALAGDASRRGDARAALDLLLEALVQNPHALTVHQQIWRTLIVLGLQAPLVERYIERAGGAVFYLDPHICLRCHYRSTELLWQCPHCHDWNSFVEERIAPAKDAEEPVA